MSNTSQRTELKKSLNLKDVLALAFGTMIGWGWIMLAGKWIASAGLLGALGAFALGAMLSIFVGLTYAELTPALPLAGGEVVFAYRGMGYVASWVTGWFITFAYIGVAAWEGPALVTAINFLFPLPMKGYLWSMAGFDVYLTWVLMGSAGGLILMLINLKGVSSSAVFQTAATLAIALGGVFFFVSGVINGDAENMLPMFTTGKGFISVVLMVPAMFVGFDVIPQAAEEMNIPLNKIGKVIIISICMAAIWYMMMIITIGISAPAEVRDAAAIPVAGAFSHAMGSTIFGKIIIVAGIAGILTSWNGFIIGATRVLFSMGRAKMIPELFAKVGPKSGTPTAAIVLVGIITMSSPLLGQNALVWFVDASAFGTVIAYTMVAIAFLRIRKKEPELERPYKTPFGKVVGVLAVGVGLFFFYMYLPLGSPNSLSGVEWYLVGGWLILGIIFFIANQTGKNKTVPLEEREYLMFGNDYKRF